MNSIGILGAGTWGLALARMLSRAGHQVTVWSALPSEIEELRRTRSNRNLPEMKLPEQIVLTTELRQACEQKDLLLFVVPSRFVRSTAAAAAPFIKEDQLIADAGKGLEAGTLLTLSEVITDELAKHGDHSRVRVVALSGPTHAEEVARDLPTTIVAACQDMTAAGRVQQIVMNSTMRVYTNSDIKGVELCGAMKNIIALACGISAGIGLGDNTKAALITRGLAEMTRLGTCFGCQEETFAGLAGMGDLVVTATSLHSRNNRCGYLIGQGYPAEEAVKKVGMVVEGLNALPAAMELSARCGVELPITQMVNSIVNGHIDPAEAVLALMNRDPKAE